MAALVWAADFLESHASFTRRLFRSTMIMSEGLLFREMMVSASQ